MNVRKNLALVAMILAIMAVASPIHASPQVINSVVFSETVSIPLVADDGVPMGVGESRMPVIFLVMNFSLKVQTYSFPSKMSGIARTEAFLQTTANCDNIAASLIAKAQVHGDYIWGFSVLNTDASDSGSSTGCNRAIALTDEAYTLAGAGQAWWKSNHTGIASDIKWKDSSGTWRNYTQRNQEIRGSCVATSKAGGVGPQNGKCQVDAIE